MKIHTFQRSLATHLIVLGLLLGTVSCGSIPTKPQTTQQPLPTTVPNKQELRGVESQLLDTMTEARTLGPANPLLLSTMYSLASFYREHQEFEKAEAMYQEAIALKEKVNGPEHRDIAMILNQYAALLRDARRPQEATALEHRALQIQAFHTQHTASRP